jgi:5'-3' exonuclease
LPAVPEPEPSRLLLDSPSLVYRAFFALPATIRGPQGKPVNAVHGYLDMTTTLLRERRPRRLVHAFDADWRPAWRVAAYDGYKAARRPDPPDLPPQFDVIRDVLDAAGMERAAAAGYEADDVLATMAVDATAAQPDEIVTGDRDLLQLVRDPAVAVLFTVRGVSQMTRFDAATVQARYGVPPQRYADFAILRGDASDGLPGIRGIGEKGAAELLTRYGSLDALLTASTLAPRIAVALRNAADYIRAMRVVVPMPTDIPYTLSALAKPNPERLEELSERHGIRGPVRRLQSALADSGWAVQ